MSEHLEERLGARMATWAEHIADGPRFSADEIVLAARSVAGRRRITGLVGVAAAVLALILVTAMLTTNGRAAPSPPGNTPSPSTPPPSVAPTVAPTAAPTGLPVASVGLDVLADGVITRSDGRQVPVPVTPGLTPVDAIAVSGGWVVSLQGNRDSELWFVPAAGTAKRIVFSDYAASADGTILVAGSSAWPTTLTAYELPSLRPLATTAIDIGMGPLVVGISGDRVLLKGGSGNPWPTEGAVWNLRTGRVHRITRPLWWLGVSADGAVARLVPQTGVAKEVVGGCLDVVPLTDTLPVAETGVCRPDLAASYVTGGISRDGSWVALMTATGGQNRRSVLLRSTDLHSGRWRPVPMNGPSLLFWVTGTTFIATDDNSQPPRYYRCDVTQTCVALAFPADLHQPVLVRKAGA